MTEKEEFKIQASDGLTIHGVHYRPAEPCGVLQIIHGAKEHKERYDEFAFFLCEHGIAVVIADNRGHGASVSDAYFLGHMGKLSVMLSDLYQVNSWMREQWPDLPCYVLGHSLGSVFARSLLLEYQTHTKGLILSGPAAYNSSVKTGLTMAAILTLLTGKKGHSRILMKLGDGDDDSWVCSDPLVMDAYRSDPLCSGYKYTNQSIQTIWMGDERMAGKRSRGNSESIPPVLSISGSDDPVTGGEEGLKESFRLLKEQGCPDIRNIVYPGMKHEVLNETGKAQVWKDVLDWVLDKRENVR